ncbi:MAG: hypothetical protein ACI93R_003392 [Flavobacteriales bacterium]|jgi:hypothetical protein
MPLDVEYLDFRKDLYFYDLVLSFSISLCGCPNIFDKSSPAYGMNNEILSFPGLHSQKKSMNPQLLRSQVEEGKILKSRHIEMCCMMLANTAYESVKQYNDHGEVFEFFRHIRNASSHLNIFNFNQKEPSHSAQWRGASFNKNLRGQNNPHSNRPCFGHLMGVADLLDLLIDVESIIISQIDSDTKIDVKSRQARIHTRP